MNNIINKGVRIDIDCQCESPLCIYTIFTDRSQISHNFMCEEYGHGIFMTSAFRCQSHNKNVGGVENSNHCWGGARDYTAPELDRLEAIAKRHWKYVKRYKKFIHCDHRKNRE